MKQIKGNNFEECPGRFIYVWCQIWMLHRLHRPNKCSSDSNTFFICKDWRWYDIDSQHYMVYMYINLLSLKIIWIWDADWVRKFCSVHVSSCATSAFASFKSDYCVHAYLKAVLQKQGNGFSICSRFAILLFEIIPHKFITRSKHTVWIIDRCIEGVSYILVRQSIRSSDQWK